MKRRRAEGYLLRSARFTPERTAELLAQAERDGRAVDELATITCAGPDEFEVHQAGYSHGFGSYYYLTDMHPVDCEKCFCKHFRHNGRSHALVGDPPYTCRCGHRGVRHRYREVRATLDLCKAPDTWFTEDMRAYNALVGL